MTDILEDHEGTVSTRVRTITSLRFADGIDGLAGEEELAKLVERLTHLMQRHVTNEEVCAEIQQAIGPHKDLPTIIKRLKLECMVMAPVH